MSAIDNTLPTEVRLSLYLATRLLQELQLALQLIGVRCTYVRPGIEGVAFPRLYVGGTEDELGGWDVEGDGAARTDAPPARIGQADRPGDEPADGAGAELDDFVCAVPFTPSAQGPSPAAADPEWWFMWWGDQTMPICEARDMKRAARVIAEQLFEESA